MKIGIISDTHDNVENILFAVKAFQKRDVSLVLHCGDIVAPKTIEFFNGIVLKMVRGNCDRDIEAFKTKLAEIGGEYLGEQAEIILDGKKLFIYHGTDKQKLDKFISSGKYRYVLSGHTHLLTDEMLGKTRLLNPGAHYYGGSETIMVLDTIKDKVEVIKL
ncbi:MAG: metallophosphoesterase [Candidatus Woesearchaeota archaeon]